MSKNVTCDIQLLGRYYHLSRVLNPSGYGDESVTVSGSQSASQSGSESYGSAVQFDLNISLSSETPPNP